jgi:Rieske 2Fe-2S family protein
MKLVAEWYFSAETMAQPGFDAASVAAFAKLVMEQDADASAMNQRGIASPAFTRGRLMPEEHSIHRFHDWVQKEMGRSKTEAIA